MPGGGTQQLPQLPRALRGRGTHQHHPPAALQRCLRIHSCHTVLGCQRASQREDAIVYPGERQRLARCGIRDTGCGMRGAPTHLASRISHPVLSQLPTSLPAAILPRMPPASGLSPNLQHLETSATIAISQEAKRRKAAGEDVIDLGAGEPDFPTPSLPSDAGVRAIREGKTHYPANEGILELRAAAAKHLSLLSGGRPVNADNIVVSNGSKQSLFNACFTLFGPGDVVAIPAPAWVSYPQIVYLSRARPVLVPGEPEWSLKVSVRDLDRVVPGARGLILCSPCNPTGAVYTQAEIKAIAHWARDRKVWIVADEIYRRIHYGTGPSPSFLDLPDDLLERVVVIYGVSKAYAMTGWRIGVALGDDQVERDVARMVAEFRKRRDVVVARFRQELPGVEFVEPLGAFYFFFRVDSFGGISGTEFCTRLVTTTGVALVPGAAFGDDRYVRLSYAASLENIQKALDRIIGFGKKLSD